MSFAASPGESLTPAISTYSTRIERRGSSGQARIAATRPGRGCVFVIGISFARVASSAALSETARLGRFGSAANRAKAGVIPEVETVTRLRRDELEEELEGREHPFGIEEGLAHAHEDEAHPLHPAADLAQENVELAEDLSGREVAAGAEPAGHAEGAVDGAAGLRGQANGETGHGGRASAARGRRRGPAKRRARR